MKGCVLLKMMDKCHEILTLTKKNIQFQDEIQSTDVPVAGLLKSGV